MNTVDFRRGVGILLTAFLISCSGGGLVGEVVGPGGGGGLSRSSPGKEAVAVDSAQPNPTYRETGGVLSQEPLSGGFPNPISDVVPHLTLKLESAEQCRETSREGMRLSFSGFIHHKLGADGNPLDGRILRVVDTSRGISVDTRTYQRGESHGSFDFELLTSGNFSFQFFLLRRGFVATELDRERDLEGAAREDYRGAIQILVPPIGFTLLLPAETPPCPPGDLTILQ